MPNSICPTSRDSQILYFIYLLNGCSFEHIAAKFFNGSLKACYGRLAQLKAIELIDWDRLGSSSGVGSGKALLWLPEKGRRALSEYLKVPVSAIKPVTKFSTAYPWDHHLAICNFSLALELAIDQKAQAHESLYLECMSHQELADNPVKVTKARRPSPKIRRFYPDKDFTIWLSPTLRQNFKLEVEMDPLRRPQIIKDKLAGYLDYISSLSTDCATSAEGHLEEKPLVLWQVPDVKAQAMLIAWTLELAHRFGDDPSVMWFTTRPAIGSDTILLPIWKAAGVEQPQSLIPASYLQSARSTYGPLPYQVPPSAHEVITPQTAF